MVEIVLLFILLRGVSGAGSDVKITDGRLARDDEFPWAASIHIQRTTHFTGGIILTKNFVITSCKVVTYLKKSVDLLYIQAGEVKLMPRMWEFNWNGQMRDSRKWYKHPLCKAPLKVEMFEMDFALIKVQKPFVLNVHVKQISLPTIWESVKHFDVGKEIMCTAAGWGFTKISTTLDSYEKSSPKLHAVDLRPITDHECAQRICDEYDIYCEFKVKPANHEFLLWICLTGNYLSVKGICGRDFGGPLVCERQVVAILTWNPICGAREFPSVTTGLVYGWEWFQLMAPELPATNYTPNITWSTPPGFSTRPTTKKTTTSPTPDHAMTMCPTFLLIISFMLLL